MHVHRIYTFSPLRNFTYLIESDNGDCVCIDPYDAPQVVSFLDKANLKLKTIINTHEHNDHTRGNFELKKHYGCRVLGPNGSKGKIKELDEELIEGHQIKIDSNYLEVIDIPGHSLSHLGLLLYEKCDDSLFIVKAIFSGDTLFNGGVGRCNGNGGDAQILFDSIFNKIMTLADDVFLHPGHDYYINNLEFTLEIENENMDAKKLLANFKTGLLDTTKYISTLGLEKKVNTFLRLDTQGVRKGLKLNDHNISNRDVFFNLRKKRDLW